MADILIVFPPDKKAAAQQIAEALAAARFTGRLAPLGDTGGEGALAAAGAGGAAILIWSRALAASAALDGWLQPLRQRRGLIEVSTDGIAPQSGDESRVVLLSGWRGQPFHLGWQRIVAELEASGTVPRAAATADGGTTIPAAPARDADIPAASTSEAGTSQRQRAAGAPARLGRFVLPAAAAAAIVGALGAAAMVERKPAPRAAPAPQTAAAVLPQASAPAAASQPAAMPIAQEPAPAAVAGREPVAAVEPRPASIRAAPTAAPRKAEAKRTGVKTRAVSAAPAVKTYSKKRSKVMRKFCARAGRGTPECRVFARSTAAARR